MDHHISTFSDNADSQQVHSGPLSSLQEVEREHIMKVLQLVKGQKGKACELLGISRPTLRKKIETYEIDI